MESPPPSKPTNALCMLYKPALLDLCLLLGAKKSTNKGPEVPDRLAGRCSSEEPSTPAELATLHETTSPSDERNTSGRGAERSAPYLTAVSTGFTTAPSASLLACTNSVRSCQRDTQHSTTLKIQPPRRLSLASTSPTQHTLSHKGCRAQPCHSDAVLVVELA